MKTFIKVVLLSYLFIVLVLYVTDTEAGMRESQSKKIVPTVKTGK